MSERCAICWEPESESNPLLRADHVAGRDGYKISAPICRRALACADRLAALILPVPLTEDDGETAAEWADEFVRGVRR